ncbi:MAG: sugar ABC transporter ATP-binding protein [Deinococcota bacterium]
MTEMVDSSSHTSTASAQVGATPLLRVQNISKSFAGVQALDDVSLEIGRGEIHCLAGSNGSGKSTLIKIIAGAQPPDSGEIVFSGTSYPRLSPIDAIREGVQVIYQDFALFPNLTVAENIAFNDNLAKGARFVNYRGMRKLAQQALDKIGVSLNLTARVEDLAVVDKQLIAISRALLADAKLIIMDEPTTALTEREVRALLDVIKRLQADGVSVVFVSHKLNEVLEVSEKLTILRNGQKVASGNVSEFDWRRIALEMTGRELHEQREQLAEPQNEVLLEADSLSLAGRFQDVSFQLRAGEVVGVAGLLGSGRTALATSLFGLTPADAGTIRVSGQAVTLDNPTKAMDVGLGYVPEDRLTEGLFLQQSIGRNIVTSKLPDLSSGGFLKSADVKREQHHWVDALSIATPSPELPVQSLSGGNQQRVVLARWLATNPKILVLVGPTVGVDVGSKADIHAIITDLAAKGMGVLIVSDDIPELLNTCHRILVMRAGRVTDDLAAEGLSEDDLARKLTSEA